MRIILFGLPDFATICMDNLIQANKNIVAFVLPPESHPAYLSMKAICEQRNVKFINYKNKFKTPEVVDEIKSYNPDVMILASYPKLIPPEIYNIPPLGTINCHPSLLPQYRGPNPYFHVIYNGETETGLTFHYTDETFDTGDIIYQWKEPLLPDETVGTLYTRLSVIASEIYLNLLNRLEGGTKLSSYPQQTDGLELKTAPEIPFCNDILKIDWSKDALSIERLIRASNPFYGAHCFFRETPIRIYSGYYDKNDTVYKQAEPGKIVRITHDKLGIATDRYVYYPTCIQNGTFYITDIVNFIKRNNPKVGEIFV